MESKSVLKRKAVQNREAGNQSEVQRWVSVRDASWPPEYKVVLVWLSDKHLPFCGYMKFAAGDKASPYWVIYHGNSEIGHDVIAWCDCLPDKGPENAVSTLYERGQAD
jgi:hypothetical protein